jgi:hypothetical protein
VAVLDLNADRLIIRRIACVLGFILFLLPQAQAQAASGHGPDDPVSWAVGRIDQTGLADFDFHCRFLTPGLNADGGISDLPAFDQQIELEGKDEGSKNFGPHSKWVQSCRTVTDIQLIRILQRASYKGEITLEGFYLVPGDRENAMDFSNWDFDLRLKLANSIIDGPLLLNNAHFKSLSLDSIYVAGPVTAQYLTVDRGLDLTDLYFEVLLDLRNLDSPSFVQFADLTELPSRQKSTDGKGIRADHSHIGGSFSYGNSIKLHNSDFSNSVFGKWFSFKNVILSNGLQCRSCSVAGNIEFSSGSNLQNGDHDNLIDFSESSIGNDVVAECGVRIDNLILRDSLIGGSFLTLRIDRKQCTQFHRLDLSDATIGKQLDLSGLTGDSWISAGKDDESFIPLSLVNAKINSIADCKRAWPERFEIDGITFASIHPPYDSTCTAGVDDWIEWLNHNNPSFDGSQRSLLWWKFDRRVSFNPQPYTVFANYFQGEGDKEHADEIRYRSKFSEMEDDYRQRNWMPALGLTVLWIVAGFGIGKDAFFHLLGTLAGSIVLGVIIISRSPVIRKACWDREKWGIKTKYNLLWLIGACVERLLPIIELRKEFRDFFEDDASLTGFQKVFFIVYSFWGWLLGILILAVLSGLTQGS